MSFEAIKNANCKSSARIIGFIKKRFPPQLNPTWMLSLQDIPSLARDEKTPAKWLKNIDYALEATVALSQAAILSDPRHMIDSFCRSAL
ncbi:uncharacterized protein TNCV_604081 [Trichonephila clavipes]|nr:uncharacterized protein TNCV_604081 [Trichonephila clavipes]